MSESPLDARAAGSQPFQGGVAFFSQCAFKGQCPGLEAGPVSESVAHCMARGAGWSQGGERGVGPEVPELAREDAVQSVMRAGARPPLGPNKNRRCCARARARVCVCASQRVYVLECVCAWLGLLQQRYRKYPSSMFRQVHQDGSPASSSRLLPTNSLGRASATARACSSVQPSRLKPQKRHGLRV